MLIAGGFTFASWIVRSQLPAAMPGAPARVIVAVLIGGGAGCVASGARHLRPAPVAV